MTSDPPLSPTAGTQRSAAEATPWTQASATDREPDPVRAPATYAKTMLHHAITQGDLLGQDANGNMVILLTLPQGEFDRLAVFDPDGDPDVEPR